MCGKSMLVLSQKNQYMRKKANKTKNKKPRNITFNKNKIFTVGLFTKMFILAEKSDKNIESRIFKS